VAAEALLRYIALEQIEPTLTMREWCERVAKSEPIPMDKSAAQIIREMRDGASRGSESTP
jgi:hypothetical protein